MSKEEISAESLEWCCADIYKTRDTQLRSTVIDYSNPSDELLVACARVRLALLSCGEDKENDSEGLVECEGWIFEILSLLNFIISSSTPRYTDFLNMHRMDMRTSVRCSAYTIGVDFENDAGHTGACTCSGDEVAGCGVW